MIRRIGKPEGRTVEFTFEGEPVIAQEGDTLAAALLEAGIETIRKSPVSGAPRGPFCLMGACFECLVEVDGENVQACMTVAHGAMVVRMPKTPGDGDAG
ncbi:MAG: (2Fe-2S)-binding protein [Hyphomicrobiales bacterium]